MSDIDDAVSDTDYETENDDYFSDEKSDTSFDINTSSDDDENPECDLMFANKAGFQWRSKAPDKTKTAKHNIIRFVPGPKSSQRFVNNAQLFKLFVDDTILDEIVMCTNREAIQYCRNRTTQWKNVDKTELLAFFGILMFAGVEKRCDASAREIFLDVYANPIFRAAMCLNRFEQIKKFIRFDDKRTRDYRLKTDKLAPISYIWNTFIRNCNNLIVPETNLTVDEQLLGSRGKCSFRQYIPSKPSKYGLKIFWMCESSSGYAINGIIYTGKNESDSRCSNVGLKIVKELISPIAGSCRNITCDNFFTSVKLFLQLLEVNVTAVGTLRSNKPEIPASMKKSRSRVVYSSIHGFVDNLTIVSYVPKKNKSVILLSSLHNDCTVNDNTVKKKPEIVEFNNETKAGVDRMDQLLSSYTCKRRTQRWPLTIMFNILDIAALNSYLLKRKLTNFNDAKHSDRRQFLKELAFELILPHMEARFKNSSSLKKCTIDAMKKFIIIEENKVMNEIQPKRKRCSICPYSSNRSSKLRCIKCNCAVCGEHSDILCKNCN